MTKCVRVIEEWDCETIVILDVGKTFDYVTCHDYMIIQIPTNDAYFNLILSSKLETL